MAVPDDLDAVLDQWEARIRQAWSREDARKAMRFAKRAERFYPDPESALVSLRGLKPSLDDYDGYVESHND